MSTCQCSRCTVQCRKQQIVLIGYLDIYSLIFLCLLAFAIGACVASFLNCWAWRSANNKSILSGRSYCISCGHELTLFDLIPVINWITHKGRCRYCHEKIDVSCLISEIALGVAFIAIVLVYGFTVETVELILFASSLLFLSLYDIESFIIPTPCIAAAVFVRIAYMIHAVIFSYMNMSDVLYYFLSSIGTGIILLIIVLVMDKILQRESMGGGDLKLFSVAALYFGAVQMIFLVIVSCIIGIVVSFVKSSSKDVKIDETAENAGQSQPIPFGPSIAIACMITMLIGTPFTNWYLEMIL